MPQYLVTCKDTVRTCDDCDSGCCTFAERETVLAARKAFPTYEDARTYTRGISRSREPEIVKVDKPIRLERCNVWPSEKVWMAKALLPNGRYMARAAETEERLFEYIRGATSKHLAWLVKPHIVPRDSDGEASLLGLVEDALSEAGEPWTQYAVTTTEDGVKEITLVTEEGAEDGE